MEALVVDVFLEGSAEGHPPYDVVALAEKENVVHGFSEPRNLGVNARALQTPGTTSLHPSIDRPERGNLTVR